MVSGQDSNPQPVNRKSIAPPRLLWSLLNCFHTGQDPRVVHLHKCRLAKSITHINHTSINKIWRKSAITLRGGTWCKKLTGDNSNYSMWEKNRKYSLWSLGIPYLCNAKVRISMTLLYCFMLVNCRHAQLPI